jgi:sugar lactone lactonase YvrE
LSRALRDSLLATALLVACAIGATLPGDAHAAGERELQGSVMSGRVALAGASVTLYRAGATPGIATVLGRAVSDRRGRFSVDYRQPRSPDAVLYVTAGRLAATLGARPTARRVVVNELTTVATGYAFAQFTRRSRIGGPTPGPQNAALMARNLADPRTGRVARVLRRSPNGRETTTLPTFKAVANMLAPCARSRARCARLFRLAAGRGGARPDDALQAVADVAAHPWRNVERLFALARSRPAPYAGALGARQRPAAWTLPVRFDGDGRSVDGPGNFAIDADGNLYVANNYEFGADPAIPRCGSNLLPKFTPDGRYASGSPFTGGGLSGAGYGVTLDPDGNVWVGNFGFAAQPPGCPSDRQPPHNSISKFAPDGTALSGDAGFVAGDVFWPQGTVSDQRGTIWIANCGNGKVTRMPGNRPQDAVGLDVGLEQAFDVAIDHDGVVYTTGLGNSALAILNPDGTPRPGSPLGNDALGLNRPMGIASDSAGNMWIANSGLINLPCPDAQIDPANTGGSLSLVAAGGRPVTHGKRVFEGGGLAVPWGIAVDGNDNVWVSNFAERRISQFCGVPRKDCRPGSRTGDPISPGRKGYFFGGLTRSTAVQIDPSGNVWATNNWKQVPVQTNPGGYQIVAYVGAAAPLKTPLIGPPVPLLR